MTGLPENVNTIINDATITFLSRAPKIELKPLDLITIAIEYQNIFSISQKKQLKWQNIQIVMRSHIKFWDIYFMNPKKGFWMTTL